MIFCFKQKTAYEMRISDWSSDVCSSDLNAVEVEAPSRQADMLRPVPCEHARAVDRLEPHVADRFRLDLIRPEDSEPGCLRFRRQEPRSALRSEERRVGKECVSPCRSRWTPSHYKKKMS